MSGRRKQYYLFILVGILLAAILLNAPIALATKLPTACNIFDRKQIEKSGPCGYHALLPKDKSLGTEVLFSGLSDLGVSGCRFLPQDSSFLSVPYVSSLEPAAPLRC